MKHTTQTYEMTKNPWRGMIDTLRVHQWVKNFLVFLPLVLSHQVFNMELLKMTVLAFFSLCFTSSAAYAFNDVANISSDRKNPTKANRPLAAGVISKRMALSGGLGLLLMGMGLALMLPITFQLTLLTYITLTSAYSVYFKNVALLDVLILAFLYFLRILAGHGATGTDFSPWMFSFSIFLFFSMALLKRKSELHSLPMDNHEGLLRRGYRKKDETMVSMMGISSGYLSVMVFSMYIDSQKAHSIYSDPWFLWLACPVLIYAISRYWLLAERGRMEEDFVLFGLKVVPSWVTGFLLIGIFLLAL